ncbi:MAG: cytochrome c-type biogenesis protein CcmH, partial [Beijerinckiaceae bacterium]|nr:cytochrome c-type biogenesis protein CcmH [Beijerinckiaceae bacterium]
VRQKLVSGDSDDAIRAFLVERYGEFILLKPRFSIDTLVLWLSPFALLVIGGGMLLRTSRRSTLAKVERLDRTEQAHLNELLKANDQTRS